MSKLSTQVENQIRISRKVIASATTHAHTASLALAALVAEAQPKAAKEKPAKGKTKSGEPPREPAASEGATAAKYEQLLLELAGSLRLASDTLSARELEYTAEQADDGPIREARDAKVKHAIALLTRLRSTVEDTLGPSALRTYGLQQETPRVPRAVMAHVQNVASLLRQKPASVKTDFGSTFETRSAAQSLEMLHGELATLIGDEDREERELQDALAKRNRAQEAWSRTYQGVATTLEGLYLLAGWKELADRVRPTQRTLRGEDTGEPGEPDEAPPDETGDPNGNGGPAGG